MSSQILKQVEEVVDVLDYLQINPSLGRDRIRRILASEGYRASNTLLAKAVKERKERPVDEEDEQEGLDYLDDLVHADEEDDDEERDASFLQEIRAVPNLSDDPEVDDLHHPVHSTPPPELEDEVIQIETGTAIMPQDSDPEPMDRFSIIPILLDQDLTDAMVRSWLVLAVFADDEGVIREFDPDWYAKMLGGRTSSMATRRLKLLSDHGLIHLEQDGDRQRIVVTDPAKIYEGGVPILEWTDSSGFIRVSRSGTVFFEGPVRDIVEGFRPITSKHLAKRAIEMAHEGRLEEFSQALHSTVAHLDHRRTSGASSASYEFDVRRGLDARLGFDESNQVQSLAMALGE